MSTALAACAARKTTTGSRPAALRILAAAWRRLQAWRQTRGERLQLLALSDRELRDIGITRVDAIREANKPFWR